MSDRSDIAAQHVHQILRRLEPLPPPSATPALVVLSGPPGVGKSTIARRLRDAAPVAIVASDFVRKTLFPQPTYSHAEHAQVFVAAHRVLRTLLRRSISTVFDATNLREDARRSAGGVARAAGARLLLVAVTAPPDVVKARMDLRERQPHPEDLSDATWEVYLQLTSTAQPIAQEHWSIDTAADHEAALQAILDTLSAPD